MESTMSTLTQSVIVLVDWMGRDLAADLGDNQYLQQKIVIKVKLQTSFNNA